ncbi:MAG: glutamyl-tRNA reductase [Acidimicrobiales bacterium]
MSVIVVGLNHRTAPLELLERVTVPSGRLPKALADLRARGALDEVVVLSTCMRTEIYATADRFHPAVQDIRNFLCESSFSAPEDLGDHLTMLYDDAAIGHLFSVASGLDSAVLGESEILAQVRTSWETARVEGACATVLSGLFRHALEVGKRVRSETAIARGTTSVSAAAVALAADHLEGSLRERRILVLGAGDMGEGMAVALAGAGVAEIQVANRTRARAQALADRIGGRTVAFEGLGDALCDVDVLLTSTGAPEAVLTADDLAPVLIERNGRPLLIVDVAVPRDVEPGVRNLSGVTVLDLDDLKAFARAGLEDRRREVARVHGIIDEEVSAYLRDVQARQAAPTVASLRVRAEEIRLAEIDRFRNRLDGLDDRQREAVEAVTKGLVAKLLHEPTVRLKDAAGTPRGERLAEALRSLFDLG